MRKMDKKGLEITLNFIVIAALVLIALIVAILFFTGGIQKILPRQTAVTEQQLQQEISLAKTTCETYCTFKNKISYDNPAFSKTLTDKGYVTCKDLLNEDYETRCGSCTGPPGCAAQTTQAKCTETISCKWE